MILALLRDTAVVGTGNLRCAVSPNPGRSVGSVTTATGQKCPFSVEFICRVPQAPAVGSAITAGGRTGVVSAVSVFDSRGPWMRHAKVYVTTRVDITGPLDDEVTVYPSVATVDAYGTPVRVPSVSGVTLSASMEPTAASEDHSDGQRRNSTWTLTVDADLTESGVDAYSTVVDEAGFTYALVGDPLVHDDPTGGHWSTAVLRRMNEGAVGS